MVWPAVIAAGATIGSGALGAFSSAKGARQANKAARDAALMQIRFQRKSYRYRYTWQKEDLLRAGINPMLAYQTGAGQALSGASYQPQNEYSQAGGMIGDSVSSAVSNFKRSQEVKQVEAAIDNAKADTSLKKQQEKESLQKGNLATSQAIINHELAYKAVADTKRAQSEAASARSLATMNNIAMERSLIDQKFWNSKEGQALRNIDLIGRSLNPFVSSVQSGSNSAKNLRRK